MCTEPHTHANTYIRADTHTTLNEWEMTQCDRKRLSGAAGGNKPAFLLTLTHTNTYRNVLEQSKIDVALF